MSQKTTVTPPGSHGENGAPPAAASHPRGGQTGPVPEEGKQRSSQNAVTHGLTARRTIVDEADRAEYEQLLATLREQIAPANAVEEASFLHLVHHAWCLLRCQRIEEEIFASSTNPFADEQAARQLDRLVRYQTMHRNAYYRALKELRELQTNAVERQRLPQLTSNPVPLLADLSRTRFAKRNPGDPFNAELDELERLIWSAEMPSRNDDPPAHTPEAGTV